MQRQAHPHRCPLGGGQQHPVAAEVLERERCPDRFDQPGKAPLADQHPRQKVVALKPGDIPGPARAIDRREPDRRELAATSQAHGRSVTRTQLASPEGSASKGSPSGPVSWIGAASGPWLTKVWTIRTAMRLACVRSPPQTSISWPVK